MVEAWQRLIDYTRPVGIVVDHSPTLCLAAYGAVPVVQVGNGFTVPPVQLATFPELVAGRQALAPEARLLEVVQLVQQRRGRRLPETLPGFLDSAGRFVLTFAELDPYRQSRTEAALGPLQVAGVRSPVAGTPHFFAYLANDYPAVEQILASLATAGLAGEAYVRGADGALRDRLRSCGLVVHDTPPALSDVLARSAVIVHHAGAGTSETALAMGCPQLLLPRHLEQKLSADALQALGVARCLSGTIRTSEIIAGVRDLCGGDHAERARSVAQGLPRQTSDTLDRVVDCCASMLGTGA
jgi:hypothetical protein